MKITTVKYEYHQGHTHEKRFTGDEAEKVKVVSNGVIIPWDDGGTVLIPWCRVFHVYDGELYD